MKMHETEVLAYVPHPVSHPLEDRRLPALSRTRVPGGWIYTTLDYISGLGAGTTIYKGVVFVPMHFEDAAEASK